MDAILPPYPVLINMTSPGVYEGLIPIKAACQLDGRSTRPDQAQFARIGAQTHHGIDPFAGHAVAIALEVNQSGGGDTGGLFHIPVEGFGQGHEVAAFLLPDICHGQFTPFGMGQFLPTVHTDLAQPGVEFVQISPSPFASFAPDVTSSVLNVLLHPTFLPAAGDVAEIGLEEVVAGHGVESGVDVACLAFANFVHRRLHVVVNPPSGYATKYRKGAGMGIKEHFVGLGCRCRLNIDPTCRSKIDPGRVAAI